MEKAINQFIEHSLIFINTKSDKIQDLLFETCYNGKYDNMFSSDEEKQSFIELLNKLEDYCQDAMYNLYEFKRKIS